MGYTSIKRHQGKWLLWRRVILSAVLFMFGLLPAFVGPGNVASAAPAAKQAQARQSKVTILDQGGHGGGHGTGGHGGGHGKGGPVPVPGGPVPVPGGPVPVPGGPVPVPGGPVPVPGGPVPVPGGQTPPPSGYDQGHAAGVQDGMFECANGDKVPRGVTSNHLIPGFDAGYNDGLQSGFHFSCPVSPVPVLGGQTGYDQGHDAGVQDGMFECANGDKVPRGVTSNHLIPGFDAGYNDGLQSGFHFSCP